LGVCEIREKLACRLKEIDDVGMSVQGICGEEGDAARVKPVGEQSGDRLLEDRALARAPRTAEGVEVWCDDVRKVGRLKFERGALGGT